jgi:hypothetical protein
MKLSKKTLGLAGSVAGAMAAGALVVLERHTFHLLQDTVALICLGLVELVSISTVLYEAEMEQERFLWVSRLNEKSSLV